MRPIDEVTEEVEAILQAMRSRYTGRAGPPVGATALSSRLRAEHGEDRIGKRVGHLTHTDRFTLAAVSQAR